MANPSVNIVTRQQQEEREVFLRFAELRPDDIDVRTVEMRAPPEADILCRVAGEPCAFELVELVDPNAVRRQRRQVDMQSRLLDACEALSSEDAAQLQRSVANASISVRFAEGASTRARNLAVLRIIELLRGTDPCFIGDVLPLPWWNGVIEAIRINRPGIVGPGFSVCAAGHLGDPILSGIQVKFGKRYESRVPIELLAYQHFRRPPVPQQLWRLPMTQYLREQMQASPFRRVWIFDYHDRRIDLVVHA